ncbi:MAG: magnesium and cobalt exporter, family [Chloroflexota bacterium]|nr:magnesium and cobalt exporter, family [Chloroflexota bacterium]
MVSETLIILALIFMNGVFSMSEMAIVSARKYRLEQEAEKGSKGAAKALALADNPNRFLSTVQIGITLIGILSGAFGGATLSDELSAVIARVDWLEPYSHGLGVGIVVLVITYLSLVIGELVPKRLALSNAEKIAMGISSLMQVISKITTPIVSLLSGSTNLVLRILGIRSSTEEEVTEEDLKSILDQGTISGIFEETEQDMVERIFRLGDRNINAFMTPRTDTIFLDIDAPADEIHKKITEHPFSRFPVIRGSMDNVIGIVQSRDLLLQRIGGKQYNIQNAMQQPLFIPESTSALDVLQDFRSTGIELAVIVDEYGGVLGLVSMNDIIEAIVGDVATPEGDLEKDIIQREDGSWLFDGKVHFDEVKELLNISELPDEDEGDYETLSGLVMSQLGRIPMSGDYFDWDHYRFEVVDMDGRRVDKVMVYSLEE